MRLLRFAQRLTYLRKMAGLTQQEFADKLNLTRSAVAMYEAGKREPKFELLEMLADFFNVDMDFLLGKQDTPTEFFTPDEQALIKKYRSLSDKDKQTVDGLLDSLVAAAERTPIRVVAFGEGETTLSAHDWEIIQRAIAEQKDKQ